MEITNSTFSFYLFYLLTYYISVILRNENSESISWKCRANFGAIFEMENSTKITIKYISTLHIFFWGGRRVVTIFKNSY